MSTQRGFVFAACAWAVVSSAVGQGPGGLELDPDLDSIIDRLALTGRDEAAIATHWTNKQWKEVVGYAEARIADNKLDFRGHTLKYLAYLELKKDRKLATEFAVGALRDLAPKPAHLATFIRRGLFAEPTTNDYQLALMALVPVVPDAMHVSEVRVAHISALLACGKAKEAVVTNKDIVKDLGDDIPGLLELAKAICDSENGRAMAIVAMKALDKVVAKQGENEANLLVRFRILHDLTDRKAEAMTLGKRIVGRLENTDLNNWTWYLMTRRSTAGRYCALALLSARRMEQLTDLGFHEYDTIALALYRNGKIEEAVEYQKRALEAGGSADADYRRRMKKYEKALQARRAAEARKKSGAKK